VIGKPVVEVDKELSCLYVLGGHMREFLDRLHEESAQTMAEYAVVLGVITIAVVVTLGLLSTKISAVLNSVITAM
jgi:Flp pilus assembly pilin Flp